MSYTGETSCEAQERQRREKEAVAFLTSLGPQFEKAARSPGASTAGVVGGQKTATQPRAVGGGHGPRTAVVNGTAASLRNNAPSSSPVGGGTVMHVTVSPEVEERRQQALRRLKATHCSVNHDKVYN